MLKKLIPTILVVTLVVSTAKTEIFSHKRPKYFTLMKRLLDTSTLQNFIETAQKNGCEPTIQMSPSGIQSISSLAKLAGFSAVDKNTPTLPTDILYCERECSPKSGACPLDWLCEILREKNTP